MDVTVDIIVIYLLLTLFLFEFYSWQFPSLSCQAVCPAKYGTLVRRQSASGASNALWHHWKEGRVCRAGGVSPDRLPWFHCNEVKEGSTLGFCKYREQRESCIGVGAVGSTTECSGWFSKHNFPTGGDNSSHQIARCHKASAGKSQSQPLCSFQLSFHAGQYLCTTQQRVINTTSTISQCVSAHMRSSGLHSGIPQENMVQKKYKFLHHWSESAIHWAALFLFCCQVTLRGSNGRNVFSVRRCTIKHSWQSRCPYLSVPEGSWVALLGTGGTSGAAAQGSLLLSQTPWAPTAQPLLLNSSVAEIEEHSGSPGNLLSSSVTPAVPIHASPRLTAHSSSEPKLPHSAAQKREEFDKKAEVHWVWSAGHHCQPPFWQERFSHCLKNNPASRERPRSRERRRNETESKHSPFPFAQISATH